VLLAIAHHFAPSLPVSTLPPCLVHSASVVPAAVPILKVFDLVVLIVVAADAPLATNAVAASATMDAHIMDESFMEFSLRVKNPSGLEFTASG